MYDLLIKNAVVITVDPAHHVYSNGYVAVCGNAIAAIGPMEELAADAAAARVIDAQGQAVMPGLVDGHGHGGHCLTRTLGDQYAQWDAMAEDIYFRYTDDFFWYAESALAAAERLKFGITTGASMIASTPRPDRLEILQAHFDGARKTGIRQLAGIGCDENRILDDAETAQKALFDRLGPERMAKYTAYPGLYDLAAQVVTE